MKTIKMTYKVIAKENPFAQKTVTATVSNGSNAFNEFEEKIKEKFEGDVEFNHAGKVVILK